MKLLVVDDDSSVRNTLNEIFKDLYDTSMAISAEEAIELMEKNQFDVVITDNKMPGLTGIDLIQRMKPKNLNTSFILLTAYASVQQAVESIKLGADDYMIKPFDINEIEHKVKKAKKLNDYKRRNELLANNELGLSRMIGKSKNMIDAKTFINKISDVDSSVLIFGPSGSGKEVMAKTIHETSSRSSRPFVAINCAVLSEQLMESELFGHEKGSFTGAVANKTGKFELASEGTIFLDELGEMPIQLQAKLLRVLQEKEFTRVGGLKTISTKARVIAATNQNLDKMISDGQFREDLFFRLNVLNFNLLPLKDRIEDIEEISSYLWNELSAEINRKSILTSEIISILKTYAFPGNIRELKNILERIMVLGPKDGDISISSLPQELCHTSLVEADTSKSSENRFEVGLIDSLENLERELLKSAMSKTKNNQIKAAEILQIKRGTLQYKLKKYGI